MSSYSRRVEQPASARRPSMGLAEPVPGVWGGPQVLVRAGTEQLAAWGSGEARRRQEGAVTAARVVRREASRATQTYEPRPVTVVTFPVDTGHHSALGSAPPVTYNLLQVHKRADSDVPGRLGGVHGERQAARWWTDAAMSTSGGGRRRPVRRPSRQLLRRRRRAGASTPCPRRGPTPTWRLGCRRD